MREIEPLPEFVPANNDTGEAGIMPESQDLRLARAPEMIEGAYIAGWNMALETVRAVILGTVLKGDAHTRLLRQVRALQITTRTALCLALAASLSACNIAPDLLQALGMKPAQAEKISADMAKDGQLFCALDNALYAVKGANVIGATAASIAAVCAAVLPPGGVPAAPVPVPVAAPPGAVATVVAVPVPVAAAVDASRQATILAPVQADARKVVQ